MNKKLIGILVGILIIAALIISWIYIYEEPGIKNNNQLPIANEEQSQEELNVNWKSIEIVDVLTQEKLTISSFDKPLILESFAVWCPTCKRQQDKVKELHQEIGDSAISISLNTDPNEDEEQVINHANKYEFDWIFAVSPPEMTKSLIDEFGITVVSAPSAPVVIVCPNGNAELLRNGVKSAEELKQKVEAC